MTRFMVCMMVLSVAVPVMAQPPAADPRLVVELVAEQPEIKTPTGIAVDERGRIFVIENNTHFRPANYDGHPSDRILIFEDLADDGKARKRSTFADGLKDTMSIALYHDAVYVATRADIYVLKDTNGDGQADDKKRIIQLDTKGNYPHNGLSGFAFDPLGNMLFSLGENLGAPYKLIGADGTTLEGGGEGGNIYRCRPDGTKLMQYATGFWNTYHLAFNAFGRLFAVDNDPDSRPPCRLLHIIRGGDYGYRFRNGRKGLHPFTAWNGELPGTLPMVAGTGEAPSGIVAYESTGLPPEYRGKLLVTSWGDHVVECFTLKERGASFSATATNLLKGGENFRPVGIAVGPDGALYLSDWVDKSYPLHGKGRIWRIRMKTPPADDGVRASQVAKLETAKLRELLGHGKVEIRQAAGDALVARAKSNLQLATDIQAAMRDAVRQRGDVRRRLHGLWAGVQINPNLAREGVAELFRDNPVELRSELCRLFAALRQDKKDYQLLLDLIVESKQPAAIRLEVIQQSRGEMLDAVVPYLIDADPFLQSAALSVVSQTGVTPALERLARADRAEFRLAALLALRRIDNAAARKWLEHFLADHDPAVRRAAIQWVAEAGLKEHAKLLAAAASQPPVTPALFEAFLAAQGMLAGQKRDDTGEEYILRVLDDAAHPAAFHALALRMLRPDHPKVKTDKLASFLQSKDEALRREAIRSLAQRGDEPAQQQLRRLASDGKLATESRADAVVGLARSAATAATRKLLFELLNEPPLRREALRALRGGADQAEVVRQTLDWAGKHVGLDAELAAQVIRVGQGRPELAERLKPLTAIAGLRPMTVPDWHKVLTEPGDPAAGERLFNHPKGPACYACHRVNGRGGDVGPDLSKIGASANRERIIESILQPSKEIAPQFTTYVVATRAGQVITGVAVAEDPRGDLVLADAQGKLIRVKMADIEERKALATSIMPENVHDLMTPQELRDVIAYLSDLK